METDTPEEFDFEIGDTVIVRVREHGTHGQLQAKFIADVVGFSDFGPGSPYVNLAPPWDDITDTKLHSYEAEFEVVDRQTLQ